MCGSTVSARAARQDGSRTVDTVTVREEPAVSTVPKPGAGPAEQLGFASPNRRATTNTQERFWYT